MWQAFKKLCHCSCWSFVPKELFSDCLERWLWLELAVAAAPRVAFALLQLSVQVSAPAATIAYSLIRSCECVFVM